MSQEQDRAAPGQKPETQPLVRPSIHRLISREEAQTNEDSGNEADQSSAPSTPLMRAQSHEASPANEPRPWVPRARSVQLEGDNQRSRAQEDVATSSSAEPVTSDDEETRTKPRNYRTPLETPHDEAESSLRPMRPATFEYDIDSTQSLLQEQSLNQTARIRQDAEQQSRPSHDRRVSDDNPPARDYQYQWRGRNVHLVPREPIRQDVEQRQARPSHDRRVSDDNPPAQDYQYQWRGRNVHLVSREQIRQDVEQQQSRPNHDRPVPDDNPPVQQYDLRGQNVHLVPPEQIRQEVEQQARPNHDRPVPDDNLPVQQYDLRGQNVHLVSPEQIRQDVEQQARSKNDEHVFPAFPRSWDEFFKKLRENWKTVLIFVILAVVMIYLIKLTYFDSKSQDMKLEKLIEPDRHDDNDQNPTPGPRNWWGPAPPM